MTIFWQGKIGRIGAPGCKGDPGDKVRESFPLGVRYLCYASPLTGECGFHRVLMAILEMLENLVLRGLREKMYLINYRKNDILKP